MSVPTCDVREHPILFSAPMVRAILAGKKSQTRRVITRHNSLFDGSPQPKWLWDELDWSDAFVDPGPSPAGNPGPYLKVARPVHETRHRIYPRVQPGDRLWVRESLRRSALATWMYDADDTTVTLDEDDPRVSAMLSWAYHNDRDFCPSIHMPRWASRLAPNVITVRAERLQGISEADAIAEGVDAVSITEIPRQATRTRRDDFARLWDRINEKRYPWAENRWVWVYEFARVEP